MRNLLNNPRFPDGIQVLKESGKASDLVQRIRVQIPARPWHPGRKPRVRWEWRN